MGETTNHHGDQDIHEQRSTYDFFMGLTKWGSLAVAALVLFLTIWFCTPLGLGNAILAALVLVGGGVWFLRKRDTGEIPTP
jgi:hypothetical protein